MSSLVVPCLCMWSVSGTASAIAANEAAEKEMEVQRLTAELEGAKVRGRQAGRHPVRIRVRVRVNHDNNSGRHSRDTAPHLLHPDVH